MSQSVDLGSEQFMELLTDALRSGPGSPQWHQALQILRAQGADDPGGEYALLCRARQHLESGRDYRSVRPGPAFTRKVLAAVEQEKPGMGAGVRTANWVAIVSAMVILAVLGGAAYFLLPRGADGQRAVEELANTYWNNVPGSVVFDGPVPPEWRKIGSLPVSGTRGLQPNPGNAPGAAVGEGYQGGGILLDSPLPPQSSVGMEVSLRISKLSDDQIVQVFVTDQPAFNENTAMSGHELAWLIQGEKARVVLPDQRTAAESPQRIRPSKQLFAVRVMLEREVAIVESDGRRLWAGPHQLASDQPRYVGVRFLRRGSPQADAIVVRSIKIQRPNR